MLLSISLNPFKRSKNSYSKLPKLWKTMLSPYFTEPIDFSASFYRTYLSYIFKTCLFVMFWGFSFLDSMMYFKVRYSEILFFLAFITVITSLWTSARLCKIPVTIIPEALFLISFSKIKFFSTELASSWSFIVPYILQSIWTAFRYLLSYLHALIKWASFPFKD